MFDIMINNTLVFEWKPLYGQARRPSSQEVHLSNLLIVTVSMLTK